MKRIVDAKGMMCPQPVIRAREALKEMDEGILEVLVDNEAAVQNLVKLGRYLGIETEVETEAEGEFQVRFLGKEVGEEDVKKEELEVGELEMGNGFEGEGRRKGQVVVISSECMGTGDEELGRLLMKGFLYAQTQLPVLPETVLLYNGGVRLAVEGAQSVEDLRCLEEQGVEILACGTCLNYYGISDRLAVGGVTNMYEIAERLSGAASVVRP